MDSCFPPFAILGQRETAKMSVVNNNVKKFQPGGYCGALISSSLNSVTSSSKFTDRPVAEKIEMLQDLDLYYVRQLARNSKEYDLERKIELEIKMREGSSKLLAAARHPAQSLEAARALLTSNERMSTYMSELQQRRDDVTTEASIPGSRGTLSISDLRFPLMWRDTDHFKNRGDSRRFAVFCLARVGTEIHDTSLLCPVDREQTDISFPDVLIFNNVPAEFELILEIYSHVLQEDLSMASTPRRIRRTIHSSISKTVGRKLAASLRDELDHSKIGPRFNLVARARMTLEDTDSNIRTHDLVVNNCENKSHALPLFEHFCCRLAARPNCADDEICTAVNVNDRYRWARLQGFRIDAWETKKFAEEGRDPAYLIRINKETFIRLSTSASNRLRLINRSDGAEDHDSLTFDTSQDAQRWLELLKARVNDHSRWKTAAVNLQRIARITGANANTRNSFAGDIRKGSLYDETPLTANVLIKQGQSIERRETWK